MIDQIRIETNKKKEIIPFTKQIENILEKVNRKEGVCTIFVRHTTAAISVGEVGEGTDQDFLEVMERIIPDIHFRHAHDPSHAWSHMASSLVGQSLSVPFQNKKLLLGNWQEVFLMEFDGPRERTVIISVHE
ncbi:YjbQ family protein [Candidatus Gottesmanbacteria bacterium]|nr:YjbQ family protein [Candidatus Gottesmanbacteria bacterium]